MNLNIDYLKRAYFYFDKPVDYKLKNGKNIFIYPVSLLDSEYFLSSSDILSIDKNSFPDIKIIQMSYLQFLYEIMFSDKNNIQKLFNILHICLKDCNITNLCQDKNGKYILSDKDFNFIITASEFEDIKRIILYQNLINYDDEYINPDLKKALDDMERLKSKGIEEPSIERKIAIITAHCGLSKKEQLNMTLRSHSLLFSEVYGEVEFTTLRPISLFSKEGNKLEHWIFKNKTNKFSDKVISVSDYNKSAGGDGNVGKKILKN